MSATKNAALFTTFLFVLIVAIFTIIAEIVLLLTKQIIKIYKKQIKK